MGEDNGEIQQEDVSEDSTIWTFSHTGGRVMIYFRQPLELNKRRLLLGNPQRGRDMRTALWATNPRIRSHLKGKKKHPRSNYDLKAEMCLAQGPTYKCLITYRCFSRQGNVQMVIVSCHSVCPVWQAKSQLDVRCSLSAPLLRQCRSRPLDGSVTFGLKWQKSQRQFICAQIYKK